MSSWAQHQQKQCEATACHYCRQEQSGINKRSWTLGIAENFTGANRKTRRAHGEKSQ